MSTSTASFYVTGGSLGPDTPSYVERQADHDLYEALSRGEFCYVLTARQMGKSSLMGRTGARLREAGVTVVRLDLTAVGQNITPDQWYFGLLSGMGQQLDMEDELEERWLEPTLLGPLQRWMTLLRQVVLPGCPGRLVIFIDEVDFVRSLPFSTDEFFAAIRECYNRRIDDPEFTRLAFCLLGVAAPSDLIQDTRTTPFNIGRRIELTDFSEAEAAPLATGLVDGNDFTARSLRSLETQRTPREKEEEEAKSLLQRILYWTGGHPYLTQRLCRALAEAASLPPESSSALPSASSASLAKRAVKLQLVDQLCEALFLSPQAQERDDNLLFVRDRLLKSEGDRAGLLDLYGQARGGKRIRLDDTDPLVGILRLSGIIRVEAPPRSGGPGWLRVRNRIYGRVFDREWVRSNMPDAELRRQRVAYRRGMLRAASLATVVLAVVGTLGLVAWRQARRADRNAAREAAQRRLAQDGQRTLRHTLYGAQLNLAQQKIEDGDLGGAKELLVKQRPGAGEEDLRGWEWRYLWQATQGETPRRTLRGHSGLVSPVVYSPDGKLLATGGADGTIRLWEPATGRAIAAIRAHADLVACLAFSPDGKLLASAGWDRIVKLWNVGTRRLWGVIPKHPGGSDAAIFSPDGRYLATVSHSGGQARLWEVASRRQIGFCRGRPGTSGTWNALAFSPDGRVLATSGTPVGEIYLWEVPSCRRIAAWKGHQVTIWELAFSPDGTSLASGATSGSIKLWDPSTRREIAALPALQGTVKSIAFSPDGKRFVSGGDGGAVILWDRRTRRPLARLRSHRNYVDGVAFSPDGRFFASAGDTSTKIWEVAALRGDAPLLKQKAGLEAVSFSPDGRLLAVGDDAGRVQILEIASRRPIAVLPRQAGRVRAVTFSPRERLLVTVSDDRVARLWAEGGSPAMWKAVAAIRKAVLFPHGVAFSRDGRMLAVGREGRSVTLWDVSARREVSVLSGIEHDVWGVAFSPDGRELLVGNSQYLKRWDLVTRRPSPFRKGVSGAGPLLYSPDGGLLVTGAYNVWDLRAKRTVATLSTRSAPRWEAAFSPDGKSLAMTVENVITLWNVGSRQTAATLKGHTDPGRALAFSPDGTTLASAGADGAVRLWRASALAAADRPMPLNLAQFGSRAGDRRVTLWWKPRPDERPDGYRIYRGPAGATTAGLRRLTDRLLAGDAYTDTDPALVNGRPMTYAVVPVFRDPGGSLVEGLVEPFQARPVLPPPGFEGCSMNEGLACGSVESEPATGVITLRALGGDIGAGWDSGYFVCRTLSGDGEITARMLERPSRVDPYAQAGLTLRESLASDCRHVSIMAFAAHGLMCRLRSNEGDSTDTEDVLPDASLRMPITLRLTRRGDTITAAYAPAGSKQFVPAGEPARFEAGLPKTVYVGLVACAHNRDWSSDKTTTVKFRDLKLRRY